ncbi:MAG: response regulator [Bacteroidota bacterium]|jgi:CheY-like chemotaxis protein
MLNGKKIRRVLLVDDEVNFAQLLGGLLQMDGFEVTVAHDGQEALEKLATFTPDAIISDVVMPRVDGFEMFKQVKANEKTASIPFLFITGFQDSQMLEKARAIGAFGILQKPIDIEQIERRLGELTKSR